MPVFDAEGDVGEAVIDATLTPLGEQHATQVFQMGKARVVGEPYAVSGTATLPTGQTFDLSACSAAEFTMRGIFTSRQGPKPGGKAPANDTPESAIALESGSRLNVQTGGAAPVGEQDASCLVEAFPGEEPFPVPIAHTLWYTIEGTGGPVTIDTAGSGFDTVIAAYVSSGDGLVEIACVDDVGEGAFRSVQAALTIDTELGVTYYVQIGGYFSEFGRLRVEAR